ncbi:hypothetical protein Tco_0045687 [Tanacetum coccineum]
MAVLESCPKHNMVAYLEKTKGNAEFHEVTDFLVRSSIHHALTVSLVVSTTFVEQFWMSTKSKIINNVRYITAKVAGKPVSISEASIKKWTSFDDADGSEWVKKVNIFQGKVHLYLLYVSYTQLRMRVHIKRPSEAYTYKTLLPLPSEATMSLSLTHPLDLHLLLIFLILFQKVLMGIKEVIHPVINPFQGGKLKGDNDTPKCQLIYVSLVYTRFHDQAQEIQHLKHRIQKIKKQAKPVITHHRAWMKSVSLKQRLARKRSLKKN